MFHRSMSLGRVYKSTLRSASSQNLIKATADVILFPQIKRNFFKYCKFSIDIFRREYRFDYHFRFDHLPTTR